MITHIQVIKTEQRSEKRWSLTEEGQEIAKNGSHEARLFAAIPTEGIRQADLMVIHFIFYPLLKYLILL